LLPEIRSSWLLLPDGRFVPAGSKIGPTSNGAVPVELTCRSCGASFLGRRGIAACSHACRRQLDGRRIGRRPGDEPFDQAAYQRRRYRELKSTGLCLDCRQPTGSKAVKCRPCALAAAEKRRGLQ
jgi:hypothetical protein